MGYILGVDETEQLEEQPPLLRHPFANVLHVLILLAKIQGKQSGEIQ